MILYPFRFFAEYADGFYTYIFGNSENECMESIGNNEERHGKCLTYYGVCDENYIDGELVS